MPMSYVEIGEIPSLRNPLLVMAFAGWNDAGQAATSAVRFLSQTWEAQRFASIDPEEFFDFTAARPTVHLDESLQRELEWPANVFLYHADPSLARDIVLLQGTEPHLKWGAFSGAVREVSRGCGITLVVSVGALLADAAHSRPVPLSGFATDRALRETLGRLGVAYSRYEGPTGIIGAIHDACRKEGLPSISLWAAVPHYLGSTPNPKGAAALLRALDRLFDLHLDLSELEQGIKLFERHVGEAIAGSPELAAYVRELEGRPEASQSAPGAAPSEASELPSSDVVISELENFLRRMREGEERE